MFKIKSNDKNFITQIETKYLITSKTDYQYVVTDDKELCEDGKINIVISNDNIDEIKGMLQGIIRGSLIILNLRHNGSIKKVDAAEVEYFEALENDVFAVIGNERYECDEKLYSLEAKLANYSFVRTSKSYLVNVMKIKYIRPMLNYKLMLTMLNEDKIDVNRTYIKEFKKHLQI